MVSQPRPIRVVVAEDEAIIRLDLVEMLAEEGYEVVGETGRGDEVFALVDSLRPDVALLDVQMPGLDGISAAGLISESHLAAVVILTAFSQRELVSRAAEAGVMGYLVKPFQQSELVAAIEVAVARHADALVTQKQAAALSLQLQSRKLIDRAKAALQAQGLSEQAAFSEIQRRAMNGRTTMLTVAEAILASQQPNEESAG